MFSRGKNSKNLGERKEEQGTEEGATKSSLVPLRGKVEMGKKEDRKETKLLINGI